MYSRCIPQTAPRKRWCSVFETLVMLSDGSSASPGDLCFLVISPVMKWWMSPSFHASRYASIVQSTDVSNSASLRCSCSTSLEQFKDHTGSLSSRAAAGLFPPELAWKHHGNEQGLNGGHGHFAGLAVCSPPWESLGGLPPCSARSKNDVKPVSFCNLPVVAQAGLLNNCGN